MKILLLALLTLTACGQQNAAALPSQIEASALRNCGSVQACADGCARLLVQSDLDRCQAAKVDPKYPATWPMERAV